MKTCNVYILALSDEQEHLTIVRQTMAAMRQMVREPGEAYSPRMFFIDDTKEETFLNIINETKYGRPNIIVSIGLSITLGLSELYKKIEPISTIFIGIYDPVAYELVNSLERPGGCMSGVRREIPRAREFIREKFKPLVPAIQKIFMPYDTRLDQRNFSIEAVIRGFAEEFQGLGCEVIMQEVHSRKEAIESVKKNLQHVHAVAGFGLHFDTEQEVSYECGMSKRIFVSDRDEFGFEHGASLTIMLEGSMLLYVSVAQMIRNFWWHRKTPSTQAVVTLHLNPVNIFLNSFILPYWAFDSLLPILKNHPEIIFKNWWVNPPIPRLINKKK
ncbi:MAG: ABC transporter substrate binding protein [bacterium]